MARPSSTSADRMAARIREGQVLSLRLAGATHAQIGAQLGISESQACRIAKRVEARLRAESADVALSLREKELARLDAIYIPAYARASGKAGDDPAALTCLRIMERRAKLLGLDAPVKQDVTQHGDVPTFVFNNVAPPTEPEPETESVSDATPTESETNG